MLNSFPRQKWLRERALALHYNYIACLVKYKIWLLALRKGSDAGLQE
jgi:hypothetical protein